MQAIPSAMQSALSGLQRYSQQVDRAAERISRGFELDVSARDPVNAAPGDPLSTAQAGREPDYLDAVVDMMTAQRAFSAQLRVIETADQMALETMNLERSPPRA